MSLWEARELADNLLKSGSDRKPLFMTSNRKTGKLEVGAVTIDGKGAGGDGDLLDLVFKTSVTPAASDFQVVESVLVGLDGAVEPLTHVEDRRSETASRCLRSGPERAESVQSVHF